jgi:hypothetical protein
MENQDGTHDDMQAAFQQFMLGSGGSTGGKADNSSSGKKKKKGRNSHHHPPPKATVTSPSSSVSVSTAKTNRHSIQQQKIRKQFWQILNSFQNVLKKDWLDVDDHCGEVLASIVNLRERVRMTSKHLWEFKEYGPQFSSCASQGAGYRTYPPKTVLMYLTEEDLDLALSHGLIQHEKMLAGIRKLISSLNQAQEALGRRLDELMTLELEVMPLLLTSMIDKEEEDNYYDLQCFIGQVVHWCQQVYTSLAQELYRKQQLSQSVLDSAMKDAMLHERDSDNLDDDSTPLKVAEKCQSEWARGGSTEEDRKYLVSLLNEAPWEQPTDFGGLVISTEH